MVQTAAVETDETAAADILEQVAQALGEGWTAKPYRPGDAKGYLHGPGGEVLSVDARAYGEWGEAGQKQFVYLKRRLYEGEVPCIDGTREEGSSLASFVESVRALVPAWQQAHQEDLARCAALLAPVAAFAAEVAQHMGEGWSGGAEDDHGDRDRFRPEAFLQNGALRVDWTPFVRDWDSQNYTPVSRFEFRGHRDKWPDKLWHINPTITVSAKQPAKRVAGEIMRRLLPGYKEALAAAYAEDGRHLAATSGAAGMAAVVWKSLGPLARGERPSRQHDDRNGEKLEVGIYHSATGDLYVHGTATCYPESATLKVEVSGMDAAAAKAILRALAGVFAKLSPAKLEE